MRSSARSAVAKQLSASCSRGRAAVHTAKARPGKDGVGEVIDLWGGVKFGSG